MIDRENGYPGKEEILFDDGSGTIRRDPRLVANLHKYQLYLNLLLGGDRILRPPPGTLHPITGGALLDGSYLNRLPAESSEVVIGSQKIDSFVYRVNRSAHEPIAEQVISTYVDLFFRQQVDRSAVMSSLPAKVSSDIDMRGTSAEDFLRNVYYHGLGIGAVAVVTDIPRIPESYPSRYHEEAAGRRPFCRMVLPQSIWQWDRDETTGFFRWVLIKERGKRFRLWDDQFSTLMNENGDVIERHEHGFGFVPVDLFVAKDPAPDDDLAPFGVSAIASSALLQLQVDDHASLLDDLQRKTNFPLLNVQDDPPIQSETKEDETMGAGFMFYSPGPANWLNPSPECAKSAREHIDQLEGRIYKAQGIHRRSQDSVEAHSGLALDYESSPIYATVRSWASRLRAFENRLWRTVGAVAGREIQADAISYPDDFTTRPIDLEVSQCSSTSGIFGGYSQAPDPVKRYIMLKLSRAAKRDVGHLEAGKAISEEISIFDTSANGAMVDQVVGAPKQGPNDTEPML